LLSTSYKISPNVLLLSRLIPYGDEITGDQQCGFRRDRLMTDQILYICQILEKKLEYNGTVHQLFIDFKKVYYSIRREALYNILIEFGKPMKLVGLIKMRLNEIYSTVCICLTNFPSEWPETRKCFITTVFQLCFGIRHQEGSREPGKTET
jgi:hypothetical protein